jgi:hypothetical protein
LLPSYFAFFSFSYIPPSLHSPISPLFQYAHGNYWKDLKPYEKTCLNFCYKAKALDISIFHSHTEMMHISSWCKIKVICTLLQ